jgi:hypothetical protein
MSQFRSGDTVVVKQGIHAGKELKVLEIKGAILLLEDNDGHTTELYSDQVHKRMLFG